jgi:hypothetical protein
VAAVRVRNKELRVLVLSDMIHPGIEYVSCKVLERQVWNWFATVNDVELSGQRGTRDEAVADAEQMIDRALDVKIVRFKRD